MTEIINARRHPLVLKIVGPYVATFSTCIIFIKGSIAQLWVTNREEKKIDVLIG